MPGAGARRTRPSKYVVIPHGDDGKCMGVQAWILGSSPRMTTGFRCRRKSQASYFATETRPAPPISRAHLRFVIPAERSESRDPLAAGSSGPARSSSWCRSSPASRTRNPAHLSMGPGAARLRRLAGMTMTCVGATPHRLPNRPHRGTCQPDQRDDP
jgi:hypothetical protein